MTRFELLQLLVGQARSNGFEFRKWYVSKLGLPWQNAQPGSGDAGSGAALLCAAVLA